MRISLFVLKLGNLACDPCPYMRIVFDESDIFVKDVSTGHQNHSSILLTKLKSSAKSKLANSFKQPRRHLLASLVYALYKALADRLFDGDLDPFTSICIF